MKTTFVKPEDIKKKWYLIDAENKVLGKVAAKAVEIIQGKTNVLYRPDKDCGDYIVISNAAKIKVTGRKLEQKEYFKHSLWVGNYKLTKLKDMLKKKPEDVIMLAIKGMLPKNHLGRKLLTKVRVYAGADIQQTAQKPEKIEL